MRRRARDAGLERISGGEIADAEPAKMAEELIAFQLESAIPDPLTKFGSRFTFFRFPL
jgi:hypothetical protein